MPPRRPVAAHPSNNGKPIAYYGKIVSACLILLVLTFASLVPGGPIENRNFSALSPLVFWGFNVFLVSLGLTAVAMAILLRKNKSGAFWPAIVIAWLYMFVFILDWTGVFPKSPDPMGFWLAMVEIVDSIFCFSIVLFSHKALNHT